MTTGTRLATALAAFTLLAAAGTANAVTPTPAPAKPATTSATTTKPATTAAKAPGTMLRAESLRQRAAADAPEITKLAAGTAVNIVVREGGWYQISAGGKTGWVRMLSVRRSEAASTSVAGIAGVASGRTGTGKVVTTTGIRGLDSGDLAAATFNEERIAKAESLRVSRADAATFAKQGGLATQQVAALPAPGKK